jgi:hypothetical protein
MNDELRTWAIVEVMGHNEYAGFISADTVAGAPMLRVNVPAVDGRDAFTKFLSMSAIYAISPCTEETARLRAAALKKTPFESWSVERQVIERLREEGKLNDVRQLAHVGDVCIDDEDEDDDYDVENEER